jgi:hypothetical protein
MKNKENQNSDEAATAQKKKVAPATEAASEGDFLEELNAPNWSIVSFDACLAGNLSYEEATKKLKQFEAEKIAGLCIITNEAASRIKKLNSQSENIG